MADTLFDGKASSLHPRLAQAAALGPWPGAGTLHIERALAPGLAAEAVPFARSLPHMVAASDAPASLMWGCEFGVPSHPDPQYPLCMFALARLVEHDLPRFVTSLTGRSFAYATPGRLRVWLVRKGCYVDPAPDDGVIRFFVGLTTATWPAGWGGHLETLDGNDRVITSLPPSGDTVALFASRGPRVPLCRHQVEALIITGELVPS